MFLDLNLKPRGEKLIIYEFYHFKGQKNGYGSKKSPEKITHSERRKKKEKEEEEGVAWREGRKRKKKMREVSAVGVGTGQIGVNFCLFPTRPTPLRV